MREGAPLKPSRPMEEPEGRAYVSSFFILVKAKPCAVVTASLDRRARSPFRPFRLRRRVVDALCALSKPARATRHHAFKAALTKSAQRSPIMIAGALVFPETSRGITLASATQSPSSPRRRKVGSTTLSLSPPIRQVPAG
jgi:hypothetical protein